MGMWVKIAPGIRPDRERVWADCREGGYICVGWDAVGDLRKYGSKDEFLGAFERKYLKKRYNGRLSNTHQKANELWTLVTLQKGDKVVANNGITEVLAVGTVRRPGYQWKPSRDDYRHTVKVTWDESFGKTISAQPWNNTVAPLSYAQVKEITGTLAPTRKRFWSFDDFEDEQRRVEREVKDRQGQPEFRKEMLKIYKNRCAISGCDVPEALQAAHIRPYTGPKSNHPCNGLVLRADLHNLFDQHLLGIDPVSRRVFISPRLMATVYKIFHGKTLMPVQARFGPHTKCLEERYRLYLDENGVGR
jgi:hypothetical protein